MGETTGIPWAKSTLNGWIGCTDISPGCLHCYAKAWDQRFYNGEHFGPGKPRMLTSDANWNKVRSWNRKAAATGEFWPVFCFSLGDVFDNEAPSAWRDRFWALVRSTPALTYLVLTKRIGNARRMLPEDWGDGYPNVWLLATMVNQEEVDRDLHKLCETPAIVRGISVEPMLEKITLPSDVQGLHWAIIGGESEQNAPAREFDVSAAEDLVDQCENLGIVPFVKQMGHNPVLAGKSVTFIGKGTAIAAWPPKLQRQEFPNGRTIQLEAA